MIKKHPSWHWTHWTKSDFAQCRTGADAGKWLAVLPVAAIEQHGPHLPVGVDTLILEGLLQATWPLLPADWPLVFLPLQTVGRSIEHQSFPGTLSLSFEVLLPLWLDLIDGVRRAGISRVLLLNAHGGNVSSMDIVAREARQRWGMTMWHLTTFDLGLSPDLAAGLAEKEARWGIHGGQLETALMRVLHPDLVDMTQAGVFPHIAQTAEAAEAGVSPDVLSPSWARSPVKTGWLIEDINPIGAVGNAQAACPQWGAAVLAYWAQTLAKCLGELVHHRLADSTMR
jgi:creatinine amidohydrolase